MSNKEWGFKELYDVVIKATYPIEINGKSFEIGEVISAFDKIQIANFQEIKSITSARGGFDNRSHVFWEHTKELDLVFSQGVFSKEQFTLMHNCNLVNKGTMESLHVHKRIKLETNEDGEINIGEQWLEPIFCYNKNYEKLTDYEINGTVLKFKEPYQEIIVDYNLDYSNNYSIISIGQQLIDGYVALEGKTRVKDDETGHTYTGIFKIPKLKIVSELSMRLGKNANPVVSTMKAIAVPEGYRGNSKVMEMFILDNDIDSDM